MKTAISIPDELFQEADHLAKMLKKSRSQLYSQAVREYLSRHSPNHVTESINRVLAELGDEPDDFVIEAGKRILERTEW